MGTIIRCVATAWDELWKSNGDGSAKVDRMSRAIAAIEAKAKP